MLHQLLKIYILHFRRHYPMESVSYCGLDPEDRKWKPDMRLPRNNFGMLTPRFHKLSFWMSTTCELVLTVIIFVCRPYFGFVARKPGTLADNQCHIFAQLEPEQPASAIINFVSKVMQAYSSDQGRPRFLWGNASAHPSCLFFSTSPFRRTNSSRWAFY